MNDNNNNNNNNNNHNNHNHNNDDDDDDDTFEKYIKTSTLIFTEIYNKCNVIFVFKW